MSTKISALSGAAPWSALLVIISLPMANSAVARTFTVNDFVDRVDQAPGDGRCLTTIGTCTLRAAVMEANRFPGADLIQLPQGRYGLTLAVGGGARGGDLDIIDSVQIVGMGPSPGWTIVDASAMNPANRAFRVLSGVVRLAKFQVQGGQAPSGGGVDVVGGKVTLSAMTISNNSAGSGGGVHAAEGAVVTIASTAITNNAATTGGGVGNAAATIVVQDSTVSNNDSTSDGAGVYNSGPGSSIEIYNSSIDHNTSSNGSGGGIYNGEQAQLLVFETEVTHNASMFDGGGVNNVGDANANFERSSISSNSTTDGNGGGVANVDAIVYLYLSNISGNRWDTSPPGIQGGGSGPGIYYEGNSPSASINVQLCTVSYNDGGEGAGMTLRGQNIAVNSTDVFENDAIGFGGGILLDPSEGITFNQLAVFNNHAGRGGGIAVSGDSGGGFMLKWSSVYNNTSAFEGGGIHLSHPSGWLTSTIKNTTVSGNDAGDLGGGLFLEAQSGSVIQLTAVTVAFNSSSFTSGDGLFIFNVFADYRVRNSILSDNSPENCAGGPLDSTGHNVLEDDTGCWFLSAATDIINVSPSLQPLSTPLPNAEYQNAHELGAGSVAIDAGGPCGIFDDQRGTQRVNACDIGSIEMQ